MKFDLFKKKEVVLYETLSSRPVDSRTVNFFYNLSDAETPRDELESQRMEYAFLRGYASGGYYAMGKADPEASKAK